MILVQKVYLLIYSLLYTNNSTTRCEEIRPEFIILHCTLLATKQPSHSVGFVHNNGVQYSQFLSDMPFAVRSMRAANISEAKGNWFFFRAE